MSDVVEIHPKNDTHVVVRGPPSVLMELQDRFTFFVPGYKHMPLYRAGMWDGKIRLFQPLRPVLLRGLLFEVHKFCRKMGYDLAVDPSLAPDGVRWVGKDEELKAWASSVTADQFEDREYQLNAFVSAVQRDRAIFLSSTSSGKTMMIYRLARFYVESVDKPALIVTTRTNLVDQMIGDFVEYSPDEVRAHAIKAGAEKERFEAEYVVSTWQSATRMPPEWFDKFSVIIADEVHTWDSKKMSQIMEKCTTVRYRFGFTGTLKESKSSELTLVGLFGPIVNVSTTRERMDAGDVAQLRINGVRIAWPEPDRKLVARYVIKPDGKTRPMTYQEELNHVIASEKRMDLVVDYVSSLSGNVLILFNRNDDYGKPLFEKLRKRFGDRATMVYGATSDEDRETVRRTMRERNDVVALASLGTFSEGMSVNSIRHVLLVYPVKSRVRLLQSIGRGLRKEEGKTECVFHDFVDDLRYKRYDNFTWRHFINRLEIYEEEGFDYFLTDAIIV